MPYLLLFRKHNCLEDHISIPEMSDVFQYLMRNRLQPEEKKLKGYQKIHMNFRHPA